ncbi:MAG TPA: hypothetical protein VK610_00855 [Rhodothermales bacterium]|nr:hypothetical protein [Rhodothermales bacterium]
MWAAQYEYVRRLVDRELGVRATEGRHRFFRHVVSSALSDPWQGVPVDHRLIEPLDDYRAEGRQGASARAVWEPLEAAGLLEVSGYDREGGLSREFRVPDDILDAFLARGPHTVADIGERADLFSGDRVHRVERTRLSDASKNAVGSELFRAGMRQLQRGIVNEPAVFAHLARLEAERDAARRTRDEAGGHEFVEDI